MAPNSLRGVSITGQLSPEYETILTPEALSFVAHLARMYTPRVNELLARRKAVQARLDAGERPRFLPETRRIREGDWKVRNLLYRCVCCLHGLFSVCAP
jgi:malate synthase